ncbi:unnamed protein product [Diamesa tonsa]
MIIPNTQSQVPRFGACPKFHVIEDFELERYLGLWYEVRKYPFIFTIGGRCVTARYGLNNNGTVSVFNKQINLNGKSNTIAGSARIIKGGKLGVSFPSAPFQVEAGYNILYTDYDNLAVVFSCNSFANLINGQVVWILTRERFPSKDILDKADSILASNKISKAYLANTDHTNCPAERMELTHNIQRHSKIWLIENVDTFSRFSSFVLFAVLVLVPQTLSQVTILGKCPAVKVKTDFDSAQYIGKWYEIQKYPFIFTLGGRCTTATYGANADGTISVLNKQIGLLVNPFKRIYQYFLRTFLFRFGRPTSINGTVTVLSPGKLNVSFPTVPQTTKEANYLVLDTDYTSYAVVFSCTNNYYNLTSSPSLWIYSRTRNITQTSLDKAHKAMDDQKISRTFLVTSDQKDCKPPPTFC